MGWFDIGDDLLGGDAPLDAYGDALDRVSEQFTRATQRKPTLAEIVSAFGRTAPDGASASYDALVATLALPAPATSARPPKLLSGELLELPYDEGRAVVGLVLFGQEQKGGSYGPCVVALDLEVSDLDSLDRARTSRWLLRPFHPGLGRTWRRIDRVALAPDASFLPCFAWYRGPSRGGRSAAPFPGSERVLFDYLGREVPADRAHEARVVPASIGGSPTVAIRAARGMNRALPWGDLAAHADAAPTPLASLAPFERARPPRPRKQAATREPDAALLASLDLALGEAHEQCGRAWRDAVAREPVREELAHALANVLSASPERYTADPTRTESIPLRRPRRTAPNASPTSTPSRIELRLSHGREHLIVQSADGGRWTAFPFREGGVLVLETMAAGDRGLAAVPHLLAFWRRERGLPQVEEDVIVRPMDWGAPAHTRG